MKARSTTAGNLTEQIGRHRAEGNCHVGACGSVYPAPCENCDGKLHAEVAADRTDRLGARWIYIQCDRCGCSPRQGEETV